MGTQRRAAFRLALGDSGRHIKQMLTDPALFTLWGHLGERKKKKKKTAKVPGNRLSIHFQTSAREVPQVRAPEQATAWHGLGEPAAQPLDYRL